MPVEDGSWTGSTVDTQISPKLARVFRAPSRREVNRE